MQRYVFSLPGFGSLTLERRPPALDPPVLRALEPLMERLGRACRACVDHARLQTSEARFTELVSTVPEVIFEGRIDSDDRLVFEFISARATEVIGLDDQTLLSNPSALIERLDADEEWALRRTLAGARITHEAFEHVVRLNHDELAERWLLIAGNPREQASGLRWSGLIQDVTARQRLLASEREIARLQLSALLGAVGDAVVGADASGRITHWNRGAERMLGYPASAVLGHSLTMIMPERMRSAHERGMAHHIATGKTRVLGRPVELPALHAAGHEVEVELVTGRYNQIRLHFAHSGWPLVGDRKYGKFKQDPFRFPRVALHARRLEFAHPRSGAPLVVEAPLPEDLALLRERVFSVPLKAPRKRREQPPPS